MDILGLLARTLIGLSSPAPAGHAAPHQVTTLTLFGQAGATAPAAAVSASAAVDNIQKFYAEIKQVSALFRQSVTYDTFGSTKTSDGSVLIQKPGKMRWDYVEKKGTKVVTKKSFISNGQYLYMVEHDNKQVMKKNLANDLMPVAISFLYGKGDLKAEFTASIDTSGKFGSKDEVVVKLVPKQPSAQYKSLTLVANAKDFHVTQSIIIDSSNNVNQFRFFTPDFVKPIKDSWFEFDEKSVKDYRIVDADSAAKDAKATKPAAAVTPALPKK